MTRKIIGATVCSPLPKPDLRQTDPSKGDYVKGKEEIIPSKLSQLENDSGFLTEESINSPTITVTDIDGGHRLTITDVNGTKTVDVMDGEDGVDGKDGVGIVDIYPVDVTDESGYANTYDIALDNGNVYSSNVFNGAKGDKGDPYTLTAADKQTIVDDVLTEIPFYEGDALDVYAGEVENA